MIDSGVPRDYVIQYWKSRASQQGKRTVGYNNIPIDEQDENYKIRTDFIISKIDTSLFTLDYGCGVGRYSRFFTKYLGVDITKELLDIAIEENPGYSYELLISPDLSGVYLSEVEQFYTSTVLQHNTNESIKLILSELSKAENLKSIVMYESSAYGVNVSNSHMNWRTVEDYEKIVREHFDVLKFEYFKHMIHGSEHALMKYGV